MDTYLNSGKLSEVKDKHSVTTYGDLLGLAVTAGPSAARNIVGRQPVNSMLTVGPTSTAAQMNFGVRGPPQLRLVSATGVAADTAGSDVDATTNALQSHVDTAKAAYDNGDLGMSPAQGLIR